METLTLPSRHLKSAVRFLLALALGVSLTGTPWVSEAWAYHTNFQASCGTSYSSISNWKRSQAKSYAYVGRYEGYQWGGGCWNDDNRDNSPNDPTQDSNTKGEGGDCSGFTFKSWALTDSNSSAFRSWPRMTKVHGPYTASSFKSTNNNAMAPVSKSSTLHMDALASTGHIGMIYTNQTSSSTDTIVEAKSEADGTGVWSRSYRGSSSYSATRRKGWTPECYPQCQ